jgi:hypothetical protein
VSGPSTVRAYAHCAADGTSAVSILALNLSQTDAAVIGIGGIGGTQIDQYLVTADSLSASHVYLNGQLLADPGVGAPSATPATQEQAAPSVTLLPLSYAFLVVHDAKTAACP